MADPNTTGGLMPVKKKASTGNDIYIHQAMSKFNNFFDMVMGQAETDLVLEKAGLDRSDLKVLSYDDEIDQHIDRRQDNLNGSELVLTPSEGPVAEYVYDMLDKFRSEIERAAINSRMYGYSVCELLFDKDPSDGLPRLTHVIEKPMQWFEPTRDGELLYYNEGGTKPEILDQQFKFLMMVNSPEWDNPKGKAILSRVYWLWFFKKNGWQFWSKFLERFGTPILAATGCNDPSATADALLSAHNQAVIALPEGEEIKAIGSGSAGQAFEVFDKTINRRISKYMIGQTLTTGVDEGGTYGQARVHQDQQTIIFNSDRKYSIKYYQWFVRVICEIKGYEPPIVAWVENKPVQFDRSQRDTQLHQQGVRFKNSYYEDIYGIEAEHIEFIDYERKEDRSNGKPDPAKDDGTALDPAEGEGTKPGDKYDQQFSYKKGSLFKFAAVVTKSTKFSEHQELIEDTVEEFLDQTGQPLNTNEILTIIESSTGFEDMSEKLFSKVGSKMETSKFRDLLAEAIIVADIIGFTAASVE